MLATVDAIREEVRCNGRVWPFALDCREDVADIEIECVEYRLRPLRWREKRKLSRYAAVGIEFLEKQFLQLSLAAPAPLPTDPENWAVLHALARWINAPGEESAGLPLDSGLLAGVTLDLCRIMQCRPADLDDQEAGHLERLWESRKSAKPPAVAAPAGEPLDKELDQEMEELAATASPFSPDRREAWQTPLQAPGDMNRILIVPDSPKAASEPEDTFHSPEPESAPPRLTVEKQTESELEHERPRQRFRVVVPASAPATRRPEPEAAFASSPPLEVVGETRNSRPLFSAPAFRPDNFEPPRRISPEVRPATATPSSSEALFEEWAERLEQAADELGIDLEQ